MAGKKPIPGHDFEMGGGGFGGGGGPGYRPTPRGAAGGIRILPTVFQTTNKGSGTGSKPSGSVRSSAAKASLMDRVKAKAKKFGRTKLEESSDAMTDFVRASGPAVPKSFKKLSRAMRREVWSRIPEVQQADVWGSLKSTPRTGGSGSVRMLGGSKIPTSHAKSRQIIEKAIADVKAGKPPLMTAHQRHVRHVKAGKPPKTVYKNNPKQMKSARKAAEASRQRGRMVDPDSVPF